MIKTNYLKTVSLLYLLIFTITLQSQGLKKVITAEDIWVKNLFVPKSLYGLNWMKNGEFYSSMVFNDSTKLNDIIRYSILSGNVIDTLLKGSEMKKDKQSDPISLESYTLSKDETKILLCTNSEQIYRRSSRSDYYMYDLKTHQIYFLSEKGKQMHAEFSPNADKIGYIRDNNLFYYDLTEKSEFQITFLGEPNKIICGAADWVYEEEFEFAKAFFWSPDGNKIGFYQFDEQQVKEFTMEMWGEPYPSFYKFKYPKAGEKNSTVSIYVYDIKKGRLQRMETGPETNQYIPRIKWTKQPDILSILRMNRLQNKLEILHADANTGNSNVVYTETSNSYIKINDNLQYLNDGKSFILTNDKTGYTHIYHYDMSGKKIAQFTTGNWEVSEIMGIDEKRKRIYYMSTESSPMEHGFYYVSFDKSKTMKKLSVAKGTDHIDMSPDFSFYISYFSTSTTPTLISVRDFDGKQIRVIQDNHELRSRLEEYDIQYKEFFSFKTSDNIELNGWIVKPRTLEPGRKYPVLMYVYGGPGRQTVVNEWEGRDFLWHQLLLQMGYIIVSVDNRGTEGRGADFLKCTYKQLGKLELGDQIETAKYLSNLPYIDKDRIGIFGWSYGGYMSSLCITLGSDYFKTAIAVAPVSSWRFYDSIYSERFLQTPQENPSGYDDFSPITHAEKLKGNFLLIHGTADDNVHFQNSFLFQDALVKAGKQFETFYYTNKNHSIAGGNTRYHLFTKINRFIEKNL